MDSMDVNYSEDFDYDLPKEQSPPLDDDSMECDFVVEQGVFPRIGDDYQVEIPAVLEKSDYFNLDLDYFLGVSVPITSIKQEGKKLEHEETDVELLPDYGYFVPGCASDPWNEAEKASFLLGLYIFSRSFDCLKQFLESKKMEDILSFYYGEFYRSDEYRQWCESRKLRKKGVGQNIFTGLRKQEFLSRILPSLSEEPKNATLQVFKTFGEGKIPFEEFIFSIKEIIGISTLVEAIGIGKGKKDLTTMTQEPSSKTNQVNPVVRTRKAFSSLTPDEIAKYLNGGYRLSKARSHDLFLEAVLPRLLARGWNSEGPKGQVYNATTGLENNLVFLVPGVKKFSRRKLKRGIDYFDSVSDVLNKVASDPSLLQLDNETKSEDEDVDTKKRHCYLQPRATNSTTEGMKFTVVDTCLGDWKPYKVRELSGLSFDDYHKVDSGRYSEIIEESDAVDSDTPVFDDDSEDLDIDDDDPVRVRVLRPCPDSGRVLANGKAKDEKTRKVVDFELRNSMEEDNSHNVSPVIKRRRLTACKNAKPRNDVTSMPLVPVKRGQDFASRKLVMALAAAPGNLRPENRDRYSKVDDIVDEPLRCSSSTTENVECDDISNSNDVLDSQVGVRIRNSFDLNLPPETENESHEDEMAKRRGTRNRPPTARALEAVAYGFLSTKTRQKKGRARNVRKTSTSSRSKRARGEPEELPDVQMNPVEPITQESQSDDPSSSDSSNRTERSERRSCLDENGTSFFSP